jgi:pyruvate/2-oxoglutarate dehydrogenase complex dihydrolipoamide acyltransferase (E2) component
VPDVRLPKWGLSMREATIVRWHRQAGDRVEEGEALADVVTDKVDVTLESPHAGVLSQILVEADETVPVGTVLAVIE